MFGVKTRANQRIQHKDTRKRISLLLYLQVIVADQNRQVHLRLQNRSVYLNNQSINSTALEVRITCE